MRIISQFKDYYDHALGHIEGDPLVWERESKKVSIQELRGCLPNVNLKYIGVYDPHNKIEASVLVCASKRVAVYTVHCKDGKKVIIEPKQYQMSALNRFLRLPEKEQTMGSYETIESKIYEECTELTKKNKGSSVYARNYLEVSNIVDSLLGKGKEIDDLIEKMQTGLILIKKEGHEVVGILNPNLEANKLKCFEPFEIYQEIELHLGAVKQKTELARIEQSQKSSEKQKLNQHGFDKKSFKHR